MMDNQVSAYFSDRSQNLEAENLGCRTNVPPLHTVGNIDHP